MQAYWQSWTMCSQARDEVVGAVHLEAPCRTKFCVLQAPNTHMPDDELS